MKYLCLLYADESQSPAPGSPEMNAILEAYGKFFEEVTGAGVMAGGDPVEPSANAVTVRERSGSVQTTAGPYSPEGEQIIGYYIFECPSAEEAVKWAAKIPAAKQGAVEVRPILVQG
jgi:hypothetical protein